MTIGTQLDTLLASIPSVTGPPGPQGPQGIPGITPDLGPIQAQIDALAAAVKVLQNLTPNHPPVCQIIPTISAVMGKPATFPITQFWSDPDGDPITLTLNGSLPPGWTFSGTAFIYDGTQAPGATTVSLTGSDGKP